jgi:acetyltransferase-like isoleucine patch superfamily enzyme
LLPAVSIKRALLFLLSRVTAPRMVYGWRTADGRLLRHTRISTHAHVEHRDSLHIGDHVFIGHFNFLDASGGLSIGEGCQITNHVSILTHSSHHALRVCGRGYNGHPRPPGYRQAATEIGPYCFIGPHAVIAPGARLGRGVLVTAYSYVSGNVPDFAVVQGQPARVVGDVREVDRTLLKLHPEMREHYRAWAGELP